MKKFISVAKIGKAVGVKGEFNVISYCQNPCDLFVFEKLYLDNKTEISLIMKRTKGTSTKGTSTKGTSTKGTSTKGTSTKSVNSFEPNLFEPNLFEPNLFVCESRPHYTREEIVKLTNQQLFITEDQLPAIAKDEIYYCHLIGKKVTIKQDMCLTSELIAKKIDDNYLIGHIISVENYGSGDIIEITIDEAVREFIISNFSQQTKRNNLKKIKNLDVFLPFNKQAVFYVGDDYLIIDPFYLAL